MPKKTIRLPRQKPPPKLRPAAIDKARGDAMALIERQRRAGGEDNVLLDKASRLLTQHWSKANWAARATLIKTADWLIRVAAANPAPRRAPAVSRSPNEAH